MVQIRGLTLVITRSTEDGRLVLSFIIGISLYIYDISLSVSTVICCSTLPGTLLLDSLYVIV